MASEAKELDIFHNRYIFILSYLAALGAFGSFVNDLYLPTLPQMRQDFHTSRSVVQLGLSFVMIGLGFGELLWGPLSDKLGRKSILNRSMWLFIIASVVSVFSPTITFFLGCRLFQGIGASGAILLSRAIPADTFQGRELAKIMAVVGAINGIAPVSGPLIGGFLADSIGWRGIFALLGALGLIIVLLGHWLPESLPASRRKKGSFFKIAHEFIPLLHNSHFMTHVILKGASLGALFSYISAGPFIIEEHYGFTPWQFGIIFGCNAVAIVIGSVICLRFKTMKSAALWGSVGMTIFAVAEGIVIYFIDSFWLFEAFIVPMLFFSGIVFASSNTLAMNEGDAEAGSASAILGLSGYVFGFIVSPLVGLGDILLSCSLALIACALITLYFGWKSWKLSPMNIQP